MGSGAFVTGATHDTWALVKTSKFATTCPMLLLGARDQQHHTGRHTDMARHTRIKIAALATSFVAAIGIMAISPATGADAGRGGTTQLRNVDCC